MNASDILMPKLSDVLRRVVSDALSTPLYDSDEDLRRANLLPTIDLRYAVRLCGKPNVCDVFHERKHIATISVADSEEGIWLFSSSYRIPDEHYFYTWVTESDKEYFVKDTQNGDMWSNRIVVQMSPGSEIVYMVGPTLKLASLLKTLPTHGLAKKPWAVVDHFTGKRKWQE